jgi:hypothetical protein
VEGTFLNASSGIRTHEAEATDLKSVPFDRSGIDADNKPTISTSAAYFNNACFSSQAPVFCFRRLPSPSSLPLLPRLRQARFEYNFNDSILMLYAFYETQNAKVLFY